MTLCFIAGYFWSLTLYPSALYMMIMAAVSLVGYIVGLYFSIYSFEDGEAYAYAAYICQMVSMVLTLVTALASTVLFLMNLNWLTFLVFIIPNFFLSAGCFFGLVFGIWGGLNDVASVGYYNYVETGVSKPFDGQTILDELGLMISF
jgi:hypothetical protein